MLAAFEISEYTSPRDILAVVFEDVGAMMKNSYLLA
jgi:hypothetical protein